MTYKVESNVPIPPSAKGNRSKYPWAKMKVGDSFVVPYEGRETTKVIQLVSSAAGRGLGRGNYRAKPEPAGVRLWRIA